MNDDLIKAPHHFQQHALAVLAIAAQAFFDSWASAFGACHVTPLCSNPGVVVMQSFCESPSEIDAAWTSIHEQLGSQNAMFSELSQKPGLQAQYPIKGSQRSSQAPFLSTLCMVMAAISRIACRR